MDRLKWVGKGGLPPSKKKLKYFLKNRSKKKKECPIRTEKCQYQ